MPEATTPPAETTSAPTKHPRYYLDLGKGPAIMLIKQSNVLVNLPLAVLAHRSPFFARWVEDKESDPALGTSCKHAFVFENGTVQDYEALLSFILPLCFDDHRPLASRSFADLKAIYSLTAYLELEQENRACSAPLIEAEKADAIARSRPPRRMHPVFFNRLTYGETFVFCIYKCNVYFRISPSTFAARSHVIGDMLETCSRATNSVDNPVILNEGTEENWIPFLEWCNPLCLEHQRPLSARSTKDVLSILHITDYLDMNDEREACGAELATRGDDPLLSPSHRVWLAARYKLPILLKPAILELLCIPICQLPDEDVDYLDRFTCRHWEQGREY
ncbi:hypothetical protein AURDEDRAFT_166287 [Auricularia subglabra TFB-10046 SS5]|uniref:BTB domain-containing protein n=1 Tax=Auricularia subglabra (strain TFB-10046 / SS5) TaxID=717982 RepID=J0LKG6_AURST|nr:hypothetical protein AURDEDRAFT_166287 [Auricularia subglabra TFB-10046 SS5]